MFASAAPSYTQALFREGLVERPRTFASNALVLAVPRSNPARLRSVFDLRDKSVRLVVGTPAVPVGDYTRPRPAQARADDVLDKVVSQEPDVKSIVGKLALGEADAGFVYRTDVRAAGGRLRAIAIPAWAQPAVRYQVAVVRASRNRAAGAQVRGARWRPRGPGGCSRGPASRCREAGGVHGRPGAGARASPRAFLLLPVLAIFLEVPPGSCSTSSEATSRSTRCA